jgi:PAS domain S-box-containing protein
MTRNLSIKQKLVVITMVTVAASLILAGIGFVITDSVLFRAGMRRDLSALASIVADNSTAALSFNDPGVAADTLEALKARPHMVAACIYRIDGSKFAAYSRDGGDSRCDPPAEAEQSRFTSNELILSHPILLKGERVGSLVMHYDLGEASDRTGSYATIVLLILLGSSLAAFLISSRLRDMITTPLYSLARAAASVSQTGDYGVRVKKQTRDEIGILVDAFNDMLARVQSRDLDLENARDSLQTTLTSIGDAVISTDRKGYIVFSNPAAQSLLRLPEQAMIGKHIDQVFRTMDENSRERLVSPIQRVLTDDDEKNSGEHTILVAEDGTEFPIDDSASAIRNAHGDITGIVLVFRDIRNRRATQKLLENQAEELRQRAQLLKETDERKDQFLAMLAHELRNPLAPIRNAVEVLKQVGPANQNQQWAADVIERQTRHLTRLVDDLLDVSRITRGKVSLKREVLELATIVNSAVEMSRPLLDAKKHRLEISLPSRPVRVHGDLTRLAQVLGNILNNAAKFTDAGGVIRLEATLENEDAVIRVVDNGIGIPAQLLPHVFDLFAQADRSLDRSQGGLGVGLTLVRALVELHGGRVEAKSAGISQGSEFVVRLPAMASAPEQISANPQPAPGSQRRRILVLEDNPDSAEMLRFLLELEGHDVRVALDGAQGLAIGNEFLPQIVLCDIGLPGMNGYQVATQFRTQAQFHQTRLVAVSGYGQEEDRIRSKQAGFDFHLTKPVEPDVLRALISSFADGNRGSEID